MSPTSASRVRYLVISRPIAEDAVRRRHHAAHLEWLEGERRSGRVLLSGPTVDRRLGLYLIVADDVAAATVIASADPYHLEHVRDFEVLDWDVQRLAEGVSLGESE